MRLASCAESKHRPLFVIIFPAECRRVRLLSSSRVFVFFLVHNDTTNEMFRIAGSMNANDCAVIAMASSSLAFNALLFVKMLICLGGAVFLLRQWVVHVSCFLYFEI